MTAARTYTPTDSPLLGICTARRSQRPGYCQTSDLRERDRPHPRSVAPDRGRARDRRRPDRRGVGTHETALASPEVVDLGGRCVLPGLHRFARALPDLGGSAERDPARGRDLGRGRCGADGAGRAGHSGRPLVPGPGVPRDELARAADERGARRGHGRHARRRDLQGLPRDLAQLRRNRPGRAATCASTTCTAASSSSARTASRPG